MRIALRKLTSKKVKRLPKMNSDQQQSAAKSAQENEEMLSARVEELTERIQKLEEDNGRLIEQNIRLHEQLNSYQKQQSSVVSAVPVGSSDSEPDITRLSIEESMEDRYHKIIKDYNVLMEKCKKLAKFNVILMTEKGELQKKLEDCTQDSEDGNNVALIEENLINQVQPWEMLGFNNPFNCAVSCVLSVVSFIFFKMGLRICNRRLIVGVHCQLSEVKKPGEVCEVGNCSLSLKNFYNVSLIKNHPVFSEEIEDGGDIYSALKKVNKTMAGQAHEYPVLFVMQYKQQKGVKYAGHCLAIMPNGVFIDVQKKRYWEPKEDARIDIVNRIDVLKVDESEALQWEQMCHLRKCRGEGKECIPDNGECSNDMLN